MHLKSLHLRQFRNVARLDLDLAPGLNLFVGPNGAGKSNLLEAVAVLATSQSHRGADLKHLVQWEKDGMAVQGHFEGPEGVLFLETRQKAGRPRQIYVNGQLQRRLKDWMGRAPVVSFSPDDLNMVKGEPSVRRRALNAALSQVDAAYLEALQRFNKVLAERNAALRQIQEGEREKASLEPWTLAVLNDGAALTAARRAFVAEFIALVRLQHEALAGSADHVDLIYRPSFLSPDAGLEGLIAANKKRFLELREAEIAVGSTLIGPHRDDLDILLNGSPARDYASQGQQRTLALAVKLAEHDFLFQKLARRPLCLLDDVLSELDPVRRANLARTLMNNSQVLVSLTSLEDWPEARGPLTAEGCQIFEVKEGEVSPRPQAVL